MNGIHFIVLYVLYCGLVIALLSVLSSSTFRLVKGKETPNKRWVHYFILSAITLIILIQLLLAIYMCEDPSRSIKWVLVAALKELPFLFIRPEWLVIIVLILVRYSHQKKLSKDRDAQGQDAENKPQAQKQSMIWFLCTLVAGILPTAWMHLQCGREGLSPYLIILLIWIVIGMCMPFVFYIKQKGKIPSGNKDV